MRPSTHHPTGRSTRAPIARRVASRTWTTGQSGASLLLALGALVLVTGLLVPLALLAVVSTRAAGPFVDQATRRTANDSAMEAAINFVAKNPNMGRDPLSYSSDQPCAYRVPASATGSIDVSVLCEALAGSGAPAESGKVPDQPLLLLGQRYGEVPNLPACTGTPDKRRDSSAREVGLLLDSTALRADDRGSVKCDANAGAIDREAGFGVDGDIRSNSPVRVASGARLTVDGSVSAGTSPLFYLNKAQSACSGTIQTSANVAVGCTLLPTSRNRANPASGNATNPFDPGETLFTDPALDPTRGAEWRQGTVNWSAPKVSFNGAAPVALTTATPISCPKNQNLIRFYPGFYTSAEALNRIFATPSCARGADGKTPGIFWFGPAEDAANSSPSTFSLEHLQDGSAAQQGVYAFDFRDTSGGQACALLTNTTNLHRWCVHNDPTQDATKDIYPVVIGGWPKDWEPAAVIDAPATGPARTAMVALTPPTGISTDGSKTWETPTGFQRTLDDSKVATYRPTSRRGTTVDRTMVFTKFGRVGAVQPNARISISIRHQESRSAQLNQPRLELSTRDRRRSVNCGTFKMPKSTDTGSNTANALQTNVISTDPAADLATQLTNQQRSQLRSCFNSPERIKNLRVRWGVSGDPFNKGTCPVDEWQVTRTASCGPDTKPRVFLDGVQISVEAPTGVFFDQGAETPATYCDSALPGVQFIFGGDSSVHLGTGAMQLCAGPAPAPFVREDYQQIAVWGQPVNFLTKQNETDVRVGKTGSTSLLPTAATTSTYCNATCLQQPKWTNESWGVRPGKQYTDPSKPGIEVKADLLAGGSTAAGGSGGTINYTGFGKVATYGSSGCQAGQAGDRATNLCIDTATQQVAKVTLKAGYSTGCGWGSDGRNAFCSSTSYNVTYEVGSGTTTWCTGSGTAGLPATAMLSWYSLDLPANCFGSDAATRLTRLNDPNLRVSLRFPQPSCSSRCDRNKRQVEGVELMVTTAGTGNSITPATGCRLSPTGFGAGSGDVVNTTTYQSKTSGPSCALISGSARLMKKSDRRSKEYDEVHRGNRLSVLGTIYAPNDAIEIADGDVAYPIASRGIVARHLRVRGFENSAAYSDPAISNRIDKTTADRRVVFTACSRLSAPTPASPCGDPEDELGQAGVRYKDDLGPNAPTSPPNARNRVPILEWWDVE